MATTHVKSISEAMDEVRGIISNIEKSVVSDLRDAAAAGKGIIIDKAPKAFGELIDSVHTADTSRGARIIIDAPHAVPVEVGSPPHEVPLDALIKWVKLRGMQSLHGRVRPPDRSAVRGVRASLRRLEQHGHSPIDAPEQVARAIQAAIAKHGTKPHHFVEGSIPAIDKLVVAFLARR